MKNRTSLLLPPNRLFLCSIVTEEESFPCRCVMFPHPKIPTDGLKERGKERMLSRGCGYLGAAAVQVL